MQGTDINVRHMKVPRTTRTYARCGKARKRQLGVKSGNMQWQAMKKVLWPYVPSKLESGEGVPVEDVLRGWGEIAKDLRCHPTAAQRYERERGLRVHRTPGGGEKA